MAAAKKGRFYDLLKESTPRTRDYVLTESITIKFPSKSEYEQLISLLAEKKFDEYEALLFGDAHEAVLELFKDLPYRLYQDVCKDINDCFFGQDSGDVEGGSSTS